MLFTYYFSLATIMSNNSFWQRKYKCSGVSRVMCQQPWLHPQWLFLGCVTEYMKLSGENKCFHNVFARLFVDLISIFKEPACKKKKKKKQIFGRLTIFF